MYNSYNSDSIKQGFFSYLKSSGLNINSVRFYRSDLNQFLNWLFFEIKSIGASAQNIKEALPFLTPDKVFQYKNFLVVNKTPAKTINRKLSVLRKFSKYLASVNLISFDLTRNLENIVLEVS